MSDLVGDCLIRLIADRMMHYIESIKRPGSRTGERFVCVALLDERFAGNTLPGAVSNSQECEVRGW